MTKKSLSMQDCRGKPLLCKKKASWSSVLQTDETKMEMFVHNAQNQTQHISKNT